MTSNSQKFFTNPKLPQDVNRQIAANPKFSQQNSAYAFEKVDT
jgi:hypothetical protein